jgi:hypothetical protein
MRLSRGCYDKFHRCPGWNGGGPHFARVHRCDGGRLTGVYDGWFWWLRFHRCNRCDVVVWPYVTRYLSVPELIHNIRGRVDDVTYRRDHL